MKLRAQGYLPCKACGERHPIWEDRVLEPTGNTYKCMRTGTLVEYAASDLVDTGDEPEEA